MLKKIIFISSFVILSLFLFSWYNLRQTIYKHIPADPIKAPDKIETRSFTNVDGLKLVGWYFKVDQSKALVIVIHGLSRSTGGKTSMVDHAKYLNKNGYSAFVIDLRSFGQSDDGKVSFGTQEWKDVEAAYDYMRSLPENKNKKIGFLGHSMGASSAIITNGKTKKGDFIIASVPFASPKKFLKVQIKNQGLPTEIFYPFVHLSALIELGRDYSEIISENWIGHIDGPILLISAKKDKSVDPQDAKDLFKAATTRKYLWEPNTGHDVYKEDPSDFEKKVLDFLSINVQ